jgi:plastocyanin
MIRKPSIPGRVAFIAAAGAATSLLVGACGGGGGDSSPGTGAITQGPAATVTPPPISIVKISDNKFEPAELRIKAGGQVRWEWSGNNPHSVLISGSASEQKTGSGTFVRDFRGGGSSFTYQCGVHGASMSGRIIVE